MSVHTYLITGAAGFIGYRFAESCAARGIRAILVDEPAYFARRKEHGELANATLIDRAQLFSWLDQTRPALDAIIHLGACARTTETDVAFLQRNNVEYSQKLWNIARALKIPFVYASSAATYGEGELGYEDDDALTPKLKPLNPYGESKRLFDLWALEEEKQGRTPPAWSGFKFFNVYGFGERHKEGMASVVLHAFDQIQAGGRVKLFKSHKSGIADGEQKRDFVLVDDVVEVLHFAVEKPIRRGIYNLGTGEARSFLALVRAVFVALDRDEKIDFVDTPVAIRDKYQYFTQAAMARLRAQGYARPFTSLEEGVRRYVARLLGKS